MKFFGGLRKRNRHDERDDTQQSENPVAADRNRGVRHSRGGSVTLPVVALLFVMALALGAVLAFVVIGAITPREYVSASQESYIATEPEVYDDARGDTAYWTKRSWLCGWRYWTA